jgi:hypothetical protein
MPDTPPTKRRSKTYGDDEVAYVLHRLKLNGGNVEKTSRDTGVAPKTIAYWCVPGNPKGQRGAALMQENAASLSAKYRQAAELFLDDAVNERNKMTPYQKIYASGITLDKSILLATESSPAIAEKAVAEIPLAICKLVLEAFRRQQAAGSTSTVVDVLALPAAPTETTVTDTNEDQTNG